MSLLQAIGLIAYGMGIGVALAAPVGPINVEIIRRGIQHGAWSGWLVGLGALSADTIFAALIVSGLTQFADSPSLRAPLFLAGAAMLGSVGYMSLRTAISREQLLEGTSRSRTRSYVTGFLMAALNPMGIVYWLSVGSALVAESVEKVGRSGSPVLVGGVFFGIFCWVTLLAILVRAGRRFVTERVMQWITGLGGVLLIGFALWFGFQALRSLDVV
ncbi:MAG: LysE family transporter [Thermomicrobiales bacterium]